MQTPPTSLYRDAAFWGLTVTQFLGAFNDNLFKQLLLLLAIPAAAQQAAAAGAEDKQWLALLVFSLPFLLFSGYAGYLADRFSKRRIIVLAKIAEIVVMLLGLAALFASDVAGYGGLLAVLFLMGAHSAFFGPAKYGILPEMLHEHDLPRANGIFLMTTFLAIIFGQAAAGILLDSFPDERWIASAVCVAIAVIGTLTSLAVRRVPPAQPNLPFTRSAFTVPPDVRQLLRGDRPLLAALLVSSVFWFVAALAQPAVNSLGKDQLALDNQRTSFLAAAIGVGIAAGCLAAGVLSRGRVNFRVMPSGAAGIVTMLMVIAAVNGAVNGDLNGAEHNPAFWANLPLMVLLGMGAGLFAVPVQVFIQSRPPEGQKGRMVATMNQANWIGVVLAAGVYKALDEGVTLFHLPRSAMFAAIAVLMLPIVLCYRPADQPLR